MRALSEVDVVGVVGAGTMGNGSAQVAATAGYDVVMRDIEQDLVDDGFESIKWSVEKLSEKGIVSEDAETVLDRIDTEVDLETAVSDADLVIEAAPEQMEIKKDIFSDLDEFTAEDAILASNTSSLSITEIATATSRPGAWGTVTGTRCTMRSWDRGAGRSAMISWVPGASAVTSPARLVGAASLRA